MNGNIKWIMGIVATIISIAFSLWLTTIYTNQAKAGDNISNLQSNVAILLENKKNTEEKFMEVNKKLDKIGDKLDQLISNKIKQL